MVTVNSFLVKKVTDILNSQKHRTKLMISYTRVLLSSFLTLELKILVGAKMFTSFRKYIIWEILNL